MKKTGYRRVGHGAAGLGLLCVMGLLLHGCTGKPPAREGGGPVVQEGPLESKAPAREGERPVVAPESTAATSSLLASARKAVRDGQFSRAEMTLERAIRLEPRNGKLWHEMAQVKYGQKDYGQAVQFALKSNSLAGKDSALLRQNWLLLEKAYLKTGETGKAKQARERIKDLP